MFQHKYNAEIITGNVLIWKCILWKVFIYKFKKHILLNDETSDIVSGIILNKL